MKFDPPANKLFVLSIFIRILNVEVLDPEWTTELMFDFNADENYVFEKLTNGTLENLDQKIYDLGFESFDPIRNSGGLFIFYLFAVSFITLIVCISIVLMIYRKRCKRRTSAEGGQENQPSPTPYNKLMRKLKKKARSIVESIMVAHFFNFPLMLLLESVF